MRFVLLILTWRVRAAAWVHRNRVTLEKAITWVRREKMPKDFISFLDWSVDELSDLVKAAQTFCRLWLEGKSPPALKGRRVALVWGATGFRNRVAFELGIAELSGMSVEVPGPLDIMEPLEDVARYLDN